MNSLMGLVEHSSGPEIKSDGWSKKYLCKTTLGTVVDGKFKFKCLCGEDTIIKKMGWGKKKESWAACASDADPLLIKIEDMNLLMVKDGVDIKNLEFYVPFCIRRHFELFNMEKEKKKKVFKDFMKGQDCKYCLNEKGFGGLGLTVDRNVRSPTFGCLLANCWVCSKSYKQGPLAVNNLSQNANVFYSSAEIQANPKMKAQIKENIKTLEEKALRLTYLQDDANANHLDLVDDEEEEEIIESPPKIEKKEKKKQVAKVTPTFEDEEEDADDEESMPFDELREKSLKRPPGKIPEYFKPKMSKKSLA